MQLNMANIHRHKGSLGSLKLANLEQGRGLAGLTLLARNGGKSHKFRATSYAKVVDCEI